MKLSIKLLLPLLLVSANFNAQISFGATHETGAGKFGKGVIDDLKKTETIFALSNAYDKATYEKILNDSWTVTPFKVVDIQDFDMKDYIKGDYSFVQLNGVKRESDQGNSVFIYVDICMYDKEAVVKRMGKTKNFQKLLNSNKIEIARLFFAPTNEFVREAWDEEANKTFTKMYTQNVFYNYAPGFLKNYFQKINNLIIEGKEYSAYAKNGSVSEISNLKTKTLYIPTYTANLNVPPLIESEEELDPNTVLEIFDKYDFKYEMIDDEDINEKILKGEEVYYLRYVRSYTKKFLSIVNSKTGEEVYHTVPSGILPTLKSKHIGEMNKEIKSGGK